MTSRQFVRSLVALGALVTSACGSTSEASDGGLVVDAADAFLEPSDAGVDAAEPVDAGPPDASTATYEEVRDFGTNPGNVRMYVYTPQRLAASPGLVVAIHGCTQSAAIYRAAGWEDLAEELGFYVVYPEQQRTNDVLNCWHWWEPLDRAREGGEAESIAQMVAHMVATHDIDEDAMYVSGLSSGGGMSVALAATYPELFQGAAIMAGIPYACARSASDITPCTTSTTDRTPAEWAALVRAANPTATRYPRMSIWVGTRDALVIPSISAELVEQWIGVHGLSTTPSTESVEGRITHRTYAGEAGMPLVESYVIAGMAHGTAVDADARCGRIAPFVFDEGICSTRLAAAFMGLD